MEKFMAQVSVNYAIPQLSPELAAYYSNTKLIMIQQTHNYKNAFILGICVSTFGLIMFWIYRYLITRQKALELKDTEEDSVAILEA